MIFVSEIDGDLKRIQTVNNMKLEVSVTLTSIQKGENGRRKKQVVEEG